MKIQVNIVRESAKGALLVEDNLGRQAWVMGRSVKDGFVNSETFEKAAAAKKERENDRRDFASSIKAWKDGFHRIAVTWQSEKAVATEVIIFLTCDPDQEKAVRIFIPRSVLDGNGQVPGWIILKKIEEKLEEVQWHRNDVKFGCSRHLVGELPLTLTSRPAGGW